LRSRDFAAGSVLKAFEDRLYKKAHAEGATADDDLAKPLRLYDGRVEPGWVDYNGHMTESRYLQVFGVAADALARRVGIDAAYLAAGFNYYTVETHMMHRREVADGEPIHVTTQLLGMDEKRLHVFHSLYRTKDDVLLASGEQMLLHVDTKENRACPVRADIRARLQHIAEAQRGLPRPGAAGRGIALPSGTG
jgi:carnitine 3-dehydrogenase